ncbi:MAG TPA: hypothetical protein VGN68_18650 [Sphingopyxis sp.]|uniref:alpha/beta fold hydrolase n=1 Tax=Sphingopyxis sp. TaxID=1908224 RepID=UPI002E12A7C3|nr:hypothetical protein [Sphingopyxis sp.]
MIHVSQVGDCRDEPLAHAEADRDVTAPVRDRLDSYLRDLPDAELHLLDGGHWLLETNLEEVVLLIRDFLDRTLS